MVMLGIFVDGFQGDFLDGTKIYTILDVLNNREQLRNIQLEALQQESNLCQALTTKLLYIY
jgi:hypothetical protein